ncbi:MAG: sulfite exporter TauE/SafE family protein [Euryarchaeota archaeon]|nr:sulfite exporter TauE/SafE family protein [Euryarchaeota archaeon]
MAMMEVLIQGISLGISTGLFCMGYCAPVFVPLLMSEKRGLTQSALVIFELALGRLIAYLVVGAAAGYLGMKLEGPTFEIMIGAAMIIMSAFLINYATTGMQNRPIPHIRNRLKMHNPRFPWLFGFLTGINICPPFLLAISCAIGQGNMAGGMLLFGGFFIGTSVYLVLLLPLGYLGRWQNVRQIALMTALLSGVFFFLMGIAQFMAL